MKLLFISHEASRSGAPAVLLSFLRWLSRTTEIRFDILLLHDGPLHGDFARLGTTYTADALSGRRSVLGRAAHRALHRTEAFWTEKTCRALLARTRYDGVYGNTVLSLPWLLEMKRLANVPSLCHLHEMAWVIEQFFASTYVSQALAEVRTIVACSASVAADLRDQYSINAAKIVVADSFVESELAVEFGADEVRRSLGISPTALVVGGVGKAELRKGLDLAVLLLERLAKRLPEREVRYVWVGASPRDPLLSVCRHDLRKLGLAETFVFVEHTPRPNDYINAFDVFAMTSREDPMPLVALAAAQLGKPIVTFDAAGGIAGLVGDDCGYLVPYLDIDAMADAVVRIVDHPEESRRRAQAARERVRSRHSLEIIAPALRDIIERSFGAPAA